ncbi:MAG: ribosome biogenesis GTP-binding protein YihA/YsxC [Polyangiales bacterium]
MKKSPEKKPVDPRKTGASPAGPSAGKPPSAPKTSGDPWLVTAAEFVIEARDAAQLPAPTVSEVAFAGRSNVGKSTLLNALAQRKGLARTSSTPGCTRGLIVFDLQFRSGKSLRLVDLPGYGFAARGRDEKRDWGAMIEGYLGGGRSSLKCVAVLVDARRGPEEEERQLVAFLSSVGVPFVFVATKLDKLAKSERFGALSRIGAEFGARVVGVSGESGEGRDDLLRVLLRMTGDSDPVRANHD